MADYGSNYNYGESEYKDEGGGDMTLFAGIEPVILLTFENRAFSFSHRKDTLDRREYRFTEFLKRGLYIDKFIFGA